MAGNVYEHSCSSCHGTDANGEGLAATARCPRAIDLHLEHCSDAHLAVVSWGGVYGSAMPPWRKLQKNELEAVTIYVLSLQTPTTNVSMLLADFAAAQKLYASSCVSCHGAKGRGDGLAAGALKPSPIDFHVPKPSQQRACMVLNDGISGLAMPGLEEHAEAGRNETADPLRAANVRRRQGAAMINAFVAIVTLSAACFLLLWIVRPSFRKWIEQPKYTMLKMTNDFGTRIIPVIQNRNSVERIKPRHNTTTNRRRTK